MAVLHFTTAQYAAIVSGRKTKSLTNWSGSKEKFKKHEILKQEMITDAISTVLCHVINPITGFAAEKNSLKW